MFGFGIFGNAALSSLCLLFDFEAAAAVAARAVRLGSPATDFPSTSTSCLYKEGKILRSF